MLATVHAYTATQALVDGPIRGGHDYRKGRAAAHNTVPETTGAAISVARAIPDLKGKFDGVSFRVPNITGSISRYHLPCQTSDERSRKLQKSCPMRRHRRAGRGF
jgi:glyceraldehyde-3-phosphate dehydrogenase/erythrose-4-phosphate dehydrogenase